MPAPRAAAWATLILLSIGFAYAGNATVRLYRTLLRTPAATGRVATIDAHARPMNLAKADDLPQAVARAGWPADADVRMLAAASALPPQDLIQIYYSAAYLLFPRRVWLSPWCDPDASQAQCASLDARSDATAAVSRDRVHHVLLVGRSNPFAAWGSSRPLSSVLTLVDLP